MARGGILANRRTSRKAYNIPITNQSKATQKVESVEQVRKRKLENLRQIFADKTVADLAATVIPQEPETMADSSSSEDEVSRSNKMPTLRAYGKHLRNAVCSADVVLEVLDARDPESFRCAALEEYVIENGKKLVLVLNKLDLVKSPDLARRWESYLKTQYPVVLFRSMTTSSRSRNSTVNFDRCKSSMANQKQLSSGYSPIGASDLMSVLANYTRVEQSANDSTPNSTSNTKSSEAQLDGENDDAPMKESTAPARTSRSITVCVVGMPNVGKSSVINSLMRNTKHLKTGNEPGVTKKMQTVRLTANIQLVDTPGVVLDTRASTADQILRGTLRDFNSIFCDQAIAKLFQDDAKREALFSYFSIDQTAAAAEGDQNNQLSVEEFLARICDQRGFILSGGRRDLAGARRCVIQSWADGEINYCAEPPARSAAVGIAQIVSTPAPELNLDNLF